MKKQTKTQKILALTAAGVPTAVIAKRLRTTKATVYNARTTANRKARARELPLDHPLFAKKPKKVLPGSKAKGANAVQVGGRHYKSKGLQPWDVIIEWNMGFLDGNCLKYLVRFRDKGGVEDLQKARHYIDKLIEVEGGEK